MADNDFLNAVMAGAQIADRRLEHRARASEMAGREAERTLRMQQLEQEMKVNAFRIQEAAQQAAQRAARDKELELGYQGYQQAIGAGENPAEAAFKFFGGTALRHGGDPMKFALGAQDYFQNKEEGPLRIGKLQSEIELQEAQTGAAEALASQRMMEKAPVEPEVKSLRDPETGKPITMVRTGPNSWVEARGEGEEISFTNPTTGETMRITRGGKALTSTTSSVPIGVLSEAHKKINKNAKVVSELESMEKTLRPGDVGIRGVVGEKLFDKLLPSLGVPTSDAARMDSRTKLKAVAEGALRMVSDDTRFSNADRASIKEVLPSSGVLESYENALRASQTLRKIFAKRALFDAQDAQMEPPAWALDNLNAEGLFEAFKAGAITEDEAAIQFEKIKRRQ